MSERLNPALTTTPKPGKLNLDCIIIVEAEGRSVGTLTHNSDTATRVIQGALSSGTRLMHQSGQEPDNAMAFISVAIAREVIATSALKSSDGFTRLWPSVVSVSGYLSAFYFFPSRCEPGLSELRTQSDGERESCLLRLLHGLSMDRRWIRPPSWDWC